MIRMRNMFLPGLLIYILWCFSYEQQQIAESKKKSKSTPERRGIVVVRVSDSEMRVLISKFLMTKAHRLSARVWFFLEEISIF